MPYTVCFCSIHWSSLGHRSWKPLHQANGPWKWTSSEKKIAGSRLRFDEIYTTYTQIAVQCGARNRQIDKPGSATGRIVAKTWRTVLAGFPAPYSEITKTARKSFRSGRANDSATLRHDRGSRVTSDVKTMELGVVYYSRCQTSSYRHKADAAKLASYIFALVYKQEFSSFASEDRIQSNTGLSST